MSAGENESNALLREINKQRQVRSDLVFCCFPASNRSPPLCLQHTGVLDTQQQDAQQYASCLLTLRNFAAAVALQRTPVYAHPSALCDQLPCSARVPAALLKKL